MNLSAIEWTDYTWNPLHGCSRGCPYCYARKLAEGRLRGRFGYDQHEPFRVTFHLERLSEPTNLRKPSKIFTCSMGELFDKNARAGWIGQVLSVMLCNPHHTFQVLTKRPEALFLFNFPENLWIGVSQDGRYTNPSAIDILRQSKASTKFISFEPLLGEVSPNLKGIDWIIIGAQTNPTVLPDEKWVKSLITLATDAEVPIFLKSNLRWSETIQEWPQ